jgi:hypothetical protein
MAEKYVWPGGLWDAEPSPYEPVATWEAYVKAVEAIHCAPNAVPSKDFLLRSAREIIRRKREFERNRGRNCEP